MVDDLPTFLMYCRIGKLFRVHVKQQARLLGAGSRKRYLHLHEQYITSSDTYSPQPSSGDFFSVSFCDDIISHFPGLYD